MILLYTRINTQQRVQYNHVIWAVTIQIRFISQSPISMKMLVTILQQQQHIQKRTFSFNKLITQSMTWRKCCFHIFLYDKRLVFLHIYMASVCYTENTDILYHNIRNVRNV